MLIDGTRSIIENILATIKHETFNMRDAMKVNNEVYDQIRAMKRTFADIRLVTCDNCGIRGHEPLDCLSPCKECGITAPNQLGSLGVQCLRACVCVVEPGHTRADCNRLCRPCMFDGDFNTEAKDCKKHCPCTCASPRMDETTLGVPPNTWYAPAAIYGSGVRTALN